MPAPGWAEEFSHGAKTYVKSILRSRPLYGMVGYGLWEILNKKMGLSEKSDICLSKIYRTDLTIIKKRLPMLESAIKRQKANADYFSRTLKLDPGMICFEKPGAFYNRYHYPVTFPSTVDRDFVASYLLSKQIDTIKYLDDVLDVATKTYGYEGDCPVSERLSKRVLIIPSYFSLKKEDLHRIAQCLNAGWAEISVRGRKARS